MSAENPRSRDATPSLAALKAGDAAAQARLWSLHWERLYTLCARILGGGADAAEVATDVLHDFLFTYVATVERERAIGSYLKLMATRRSLRRRAARDRQRELIAEHQPAGEARSAEDLAALSLLRPRLAACLGELSPKAQQVLALRFGRELTTKRIGELVGGSKQYIGRLIRQSTDKLRACLERTAP